MSCNVFVDNELFNPKKPSTGTLNTQVLCSAFIKVKSRFQDHPVQRQSADLEWISMESEIDEDGSG